ncbi:MAG: phage portal protein [Verrucomicrobiia bacterium]
MTTPDKSTTPVKMNWLDKFILNISPERAAKRFQFRNLIMRMYEGANTSEARQWRWGMPLDADRELPQYDRLTMVDRGRYERANLGFLQGAIDDLVRYSLGPRGLFPESQSEDDAWKKEIDDLFPLWSRMADATGRFTFGELQRLAVQMTVHDGDCGLIYVKDENRLPKLQFIEGHLINDDGTMNNGTVDRPVVEGVITDGANTPLGYRILVKKENGQRRAITVDAANFIHFYDPKRYTGTRGIPWFAASINQGLDIFDIVAYEKHFLKNASSKSLIETNDSGHADSAADWINAAATPAEPVDAESGKLAPGVVEEKLESGTIVYHRANAGHDLKAFQFDRPTAAFRDFIDWLESDIYLNLGMPANWKNIHKERGATLRAAMAKANRRFEEIAVLVENRICFPSWNWLTFEAGRLKITRPRPKDWHKVVWYGPALSTVDAGRDAKANLRY